MVKKSILWGVILFCIASSIIFYKFSLIPQHLAFDEVEFGKLALMLKDTFYTPYHSYATGHATLYFYFILLSFMLFGVSEFALRLPAAVFGVLSVWVFYRLMSLVFPNYHLSFGSAHDKLRRFTIPLSFIVAVVLVASRWYFNFARFAFEATFLTFLELASLYFVLKFAESKKKIHIVFSGIFAGLAYNSYIPGRIFFIVPLLFLIMLGKERIRSILFYTASFITIILPLTIYLFQHPDIRINQQFYPANTELTLQDKSEFFASNLLGNIKMFYVPGNGDGNGRHNFPLKPALNPILFALFIVGLSVGLRNFRHRFNAVFLLYLFVGFIPTLFTYPWENPNMLRTYTMLPGVVYFVGVGFFTLYDVVKRRVKWRLLKNGLILGLLGVLLLSSVYELRTYFVYQAKYVTPHAFDVFDGMSQIKKSDKH